MEKFRQRFSTEKNNFDLPLNYLHLTVVLKRNFASFTRQTFL